MSIELNLGRGALVAGRVLERVGSIVKAACGGWVWYKSVLVQLRLVLLDRGELSRCCTEMERRGSVRGYVGVRDRIAKGTSKSGRFYAFVNPPSENTSPSGSGLNARCSRGTPRRRPAKEGPESPLFWAPLAPGTSPETWPTQHESQRASPGAPSGGLRGGE